MGYLDHYQQINWVKKKTNCRKNIIHFLPKSYLRKRKLNSLPQHVITKNTNIFPVFQRLMNYFSMTRMGPIVPGFDSSTKTFSEAALQRRVLRKRCSENMQQIYRRTPILKYDFNKIALQLCQLQLTFRMSI